MATPCLVHAATLKLQSIGSIHAYMRAALDGQYLVSISRLGMTSHMEV